MRTIVIGILSKLLVCVYLVCFMKKKHRKKEIKKLVGTGNRVRKGHLKRSARDREYQQTTFIFRALIIQGMFNEFAVCFEILWLARARISQIKPETSRQQQQQSIIVLVPKCVCTHKCSCIYYLRICNAIHIYILYI